MKKNVKGLKKILAVITVAIMLVSSVPQTEFKSEAMELTEASDSVSQENESEQQDETGAVDETKCILKISYRICLRSVDRPFVMR